MDLTTQFRIIKVLEEIRDELRTANDLTEELNKPIQFEVPSESTEFPRFGDVGVIP